MASLHYSRSRALSDDAVRAETLLVRYPDLSEQELADLLRTFARLPLLDFGLIAADRRLGAHLDSFYDDHGHRLWPPLSKWAWAVAVPLVMVTLALLYSAVA